ncbi:hypothetical protein SAMN04488128_103469 [Chitinophaga eiseniae]|uniref:Uncharacterized protein n=1 Tax=Chitinophaga eiseniae TaxID=634771 RepID=A0A1T4ST86_9BACT|nr:hypothetical protein [Chitinophaga eiseniae]SKA31393.1 hypothetical protein SAMN04488128_103469 [Chitinophaga eiseniae]
MDSSLTASGLIPAQQKGGQSNTSYCRRAEDPEAAVVLYEVARRRLLDVNQWQLLSGPLSARFQLVNPQGEPMYRSVREGDYIRINLPGPGPHAGRGFDWVQVEQVSSREQAYTGMRVRPLPLPQSADRETAHFFKHHATSSFIVEKNGLEVKASVYGRNEIPNTGVRAFLDKVRNLFTAIGAILGMSKAQWGNLVKGIVDG